MESSIFFYPASSRCPVAYFQGGVGLPPERIVQPRSRFCGFGRFQHFVGIGQTLTGVLRRLQGAAHSKKAAHQGLGVAQPPCHGDRLPGIFQAAFARASIYQRKGQTAQDRRPQGILIFSNYLEGFLK
jgi:hypothetical protein